MPLNTRGLMPSINPYQITGPPGFDPSTGLMTEDNPLLTATAGLSPSVQPATGPQPPTLEQPNKNAWMLPLLGAIIGKAMGKPLLGFAVGAQGAAAQQQGIKSRNDKAVRQAQAKQAQDRADQQAKSLEDQRKAGIRASAIDVALKAGGAAAVAFAHSNGIEDMDPQLQDIETAQSKKEAATRALHEADNKAQAQREKDKAEDAFNKAVAVAKIQAQSKTDVADIKAQSYDQMTPAQLERAREQALRTWANTESNVLASEEVKKAAKDNYDAVDVVYKRKFPGQGKADPRQGKVVAPPPKTLIQQGVAAGPGVPANLTNTTGLLPTPTPADSPAVQPTQAQPQPVATQPAPAGTTPQGMGGCGTVPAGTTVTPPVSNAKPFNEKTSIQSIVNGLHWTEAEVKQAIVVNMRLRGLSREDAIRRVALDNNVLLTP